MAVKELFAIDKKPIKGLLAVEWIALAYLLFTVLMMAFMWTKMQHAEPLLWGRFRFLTTTLALWAVYRMVPCRLTLFFRIAVQMIFLSWWYPDTYELNRNLPNLDHLFAAADQAVFGFQPALLFSEKMPWGWFSEIMCMSYVSYFPLMALVLIYYFLARYNEFRQAAFILLGSFFIYYVIFVLLPVTGPQYYYLAAGTDNIAAGTFPHLGDWFYSHYERMAPPGWTDGFFYHLLEAAHDAGERPTAAFPSSHVGITTVVTLLALHTRSRRLVATVLPFYILMCFATVYIMAHYAVDVAGGLVTGAVFYFSLLFLWQRHQEPLH